MIPGVLNVTNKVSMRLMHMLDMVKDMLHLAKVKSGDPLGEIAELDMVESCRGAV